jgi:hypothetical protein
VRAIFTDGVLDAFLLIDREDIRFVDRLVAEEAMVERVRRLFARLDDVS